MWMAAQNSESKQRSGKARRAPINHSKINMAGKSSSGSQMRWGSSRSFSSGRSAHRDSALQPDDRRSRFADRRALGPVANRSVFIAADTVRAVKGASFNVH